MGWLITYCTTCEFRWFCPEASVFVVLFFMFFFFVSDGLVRVSREGYVGVESA